MSNSPANKKLLFRPEIFSPEIAIVKKFAAQLERYPKASQTFALIGIDEVGRGCVAGPVVVAATLWLVGDAQNHRGVFDHTGDHCAQIKDSKLLTEKKREAIYDQFCRQQALTILYPPAPKQEAEHPFENPLASQFDFGMLQRPAVAHKYNNLEQILGLRVQETEISSAQARVCPELTEEMGTPTAECARKANTGGFEAVIRAGSLQTQACDHSIELVAVAIASASPAEIEELNIWGATQLSISRALRSLEGAKLPLPEHFELCKQTVICFDGALPSKVPASFQSLPFVTVVKGDQILKSIALASIFAKVYRDRLLQALDQSLPGYGFAKHKGYGTEMHRLAIKRLGMTQAHRPSFLRNILLDN